MKITVIFETLLYPVFLHSMSISQLCQSLSRNSFSFPLPLPLAMCYSISRCCLSSGIHGYQLSEFRIGVGRVENVSSIFSLALNQFSHVTLYLGNLVTLQLLVQLSSGVDFEMVSIKFSGKTDGLHLEKQSPRIQLQTRLFLASETGDRSLG